MSLSLTPITAHWKGSFAGRGAFTSDDFASSVTLPRDFQGLGQGATPENLLLGAIASCYLITLGIMLDKAGIAYGELKLEGELRTEVGPRPTIREVELRPSIATAADPEKVQALAGKAEQFCLIARAIAGNVEKIVKPIQVSVLADTPLAITQ